MVARLDVSLTDEPPLAQAVVIITALPAAAIGLTATGSRPTAATALELDTPGRGGLDRRAPRAAY